MKIPLIALGLSAATGCARWMTCPARGGPPWIALSTAHLELVTDLPEEDARSFLDRADRSRRAVIEVALAKLPPPPGVTRIIAFREQEYLYRYSDRTTSARYLARPNLAIDEPATMLIYAEDTHSADRGLQRMFAYRALHHAIAQAPLWFGAGLAEYAASILIEDDAVVMGRVPSNAGNQGETYCTSHDNLSCVFFNPEMNPLSLEQLLEADPITFYVADPRYNKPAERADERRNNVASAWRLIHLFRHGQRDYTARFDRYLAALAEGRSREESWNAGFADLPRDELSHALNTHLLAEMPRTSSTPLPPAAAEPPRLRPLTSAEVHALWAELEPWRVEARRDAAVAELDEALAEDPSSAAALIVRGGLLRSIGQVEEAKSNFERAATLSPKDPRPWLALFELETEKLEKTPPAERNWYPSEALLNSLRKLASSARALAGIARWYAIRELPADGLPYATRAIRADRGCVPCWDTLAELYRQGNLLQDAVNAQRIAVNLSADDRAGAALAQKLERLEAAATSTSSAH